MNVSLFWRRVYTNFSARYDQITTFKADILFNVIETVLQVFMWYFMAKIIDSSTLGYPVNYVAFIFVGSLASFFVSEVGSSLAGSFARDMSEGLMKLAYLSNMGIIEYFFINFFTNIVFSLVLYIGPLAMTFFFISGYIPELGTFFLGYWNLLTLFIAIIIFMVGNLGFTLMSMGSTLYLKEGDPVSFILGQLNNFFSGQVFPLSVLPKFLLFIPKILPTAYIILLFRDSIFLNKTILMPEIVSISIVGLIINAAVFVIGFYLFQVGVKRAKLEGRWM